ncbi:MAG: hypothetical protein JNL21_16705 [Myxococcales bacterium]|nr:hypothetical protein [Myxococcales bacterium]
MDDMEPGEGATLVYDKRTGRFVLARSGEGAMPEGWVGRQGGHGPVLEQHWGVTDATKVQGSNNPFVGGSISKGADGAFSFGWNSGQIQIGYITASPIDQAAALSAIGQFANPLTPSGLVNLIQGAPATPSGLLNALSPPSSFYPNVK